MNESGNKRIVGVGIFIVIGLLFLLGGVLTVGNLHSAFQNKITISTVFGDVNGLQSGNNIWFSGVKIGTVKRTEFYGKSQVKVLMNINTESQQYIRKDAKVKVSTDGLIGNRILVIYGGTSFAPQIEEGDTLSNESMLSTEDIMNTFQQNNLNVLTLTKKLAAGEGTIGKLLQDDSLYNSLTMTSNSLQATSAHAKMLISALGKFSANLNKSGTLANNLATDTTIFHSFQTSVFSLQHVVDTVGLFANNLKEGSKNPKTPVGVMFHDEQAGADLKSTIAKLDSAAIKLNEDLERLQNSFLLRRFFKGEKKIAKNDFIEIKT